MKMESQASLLFAFLFFVALFRDSNVEATSFVFENKCSFNIWPGVLTASGSRPFPTTGFGLRSGGRLTFYAPAGWSGRVWARTSCFVGASGNFTCGTGDCGTGAILCNGRGGAAPITQVGFTLGTYSADVYHASLLDGFNVPVLVTPSPPACKRTGCAVRLGKACLPELKQRGADGEVAGCLSACAMFGTAEYCCTGQYASPERCKPNAYSQFFKSRCPLAYSYVYDNVDTNFGCSRANYVVTFCP